LGCGQVMYAYVMRPETIPDSYYRFILRTGPIDEKMLKAVRALNRGKALDVKGLIEFCRAKIAGAIKKGTHPNLPNLENYIPPSLIDTVTRGEKPPVIGCDLLHPQNPNCRHQVTWAFLSVARKIFPVYATLTLIPLFALRFRSILRHPITTSIKAFASICQSTTFLAVFVAVYQAVICFHRKTGGVDRRAIYYVAGLIASFALLIEKKSRRAELALYTLPRAIDSLYLQMVDRRYFFPVPHGDVILCCLSLGGLMYSYVHEPDTMSPLLFSVFDFLLSRKRVKLF